MHVASSRDFAFSAVKLQVLNTLTSILTGIVRPRVPCVSRVCPVCVPAPPVSFYRNPGFL